MSEAFSQCLQAWMKETSRSIFSVSNVAGLKSKTTVARILNGESTYQSCSRFYEALSNGIHLEKKWEQRFLDSLRAERIGLREYELFETLKQQVFKMPSKTIPPNTGKEMNVLILGCPWRKTNDAIQLWLSRNSRVSIHHYMTSRELYEHSAALAGLMDRLTEKRYQAYAIEEEKLLAAEISWNIILCADRDSGDKSIGLKSGDSFSWHQLSSDNSLYEEYHNILSAIGRKELYNNGDLKKGSDYIRLQTESWEMENRHSKAIVKPTPGIQMLPVDLGIDSFTDYLNENIVPISASANSLVYYYRKRAENFYSYEIKMILSRQEMKRFVHSGRLVDQFFACRPYTEKERLTILNYLLDCMEQPQVRILFSDSNLSKRFTFETYSKYGTLIYPSKTSYNGEEDNYRELVLPGDQWAELFTRFIDEIIIPEYCCSDSEAHEFLQKLVLNMQTKEL